MINTDTYYIKENAPLVLEVPCAWPQSLCEATHAPPGVPYGNDNRCMTSYKSNQSDEGRTGHD